MTDSTDLESAFDYYWRVAASAEGVEAPELVAQWRLGRWPFDRAAVGAPVLFELDGGSRGRPLTCQDCGARVRAPMANGSRGSVVSQPLGHATHDGMTRDRRKGNDAALAGYFVFRFTAEMLDSDPVGVLCPIIRLVIRLKSAGQSAG